MLVPLGERPSGGPQPGAFLEQALHALNVGGLDSSIDRPEPVLVHRLDVGAVLDEAAHDPLPMEEL